MPYIRYVTTEVTANGEEGPCNRVCLDGEFTSREVVQVLKELWKRGAIDDVSELVDLVRASGFPDGTAIGDEIADALDKFEA